MTEFAQSAVRHESVGVLLALRERALGCQRREHGDERCGGVVVSTSAERTQGLQIVQTGDGWKTREKYQLPATAECDVCRVTCVV